MQDTVRITRNTDMYNITRTLSENIPAKDLEKRIEDYEKQLKEQQEQLKEFVKNKSAMVKQYRKQLNKAEEDMKKNIRILEENLKAMKDAKEKGIGEATSLYHDKEALK